jgi:hypothetical protein
MRHSLPHASKRSPATERSTRGPGPCVVDVAQSGAAPHSTVEEDEMTVRTHRRKLGRAGLLALAACVVGAAAAPAAQATVPDTIIEHPFNGIAINASQPFVDFHSTVPNSRFLCHFDSDRDVDCLFTFHPRNPLSEGRHTFSVQAVAPTGELDPSPATDSFIVDTIAPDTTIDTPGGPTNDNTPSFAFHASEVGDRFECRLDFQPDFSCDRSPVTLGPLADGSYVLRVRAKDPALNVDPTPAQVAFVVDATAPDTRITAGPSGSTPNHTPTFEFIAADPFAALLSPVSFTCSMDGEPAFACSSPYTSPKVGNGDHTFAVTAFDAFGNVDPTPATRSFFASPIGGK